MYIYVKIRVDNDDERGQYLLTGSANLRFAKAIKDYLAGRKLIVLFFRHFIFLDDGCSASII